MGQEVCTPSGTSVKKFILPSSHSCNGLMVERDVSVHIVGRFSVQVLDSVQDVPAPAGNSPCNPAVVLEAVPCMLLCDGVRLTQRCRRIPGITIMCRHDQQCSESWRALLSSQCPILFSRSATGHSHIRPSHKLRLSLWSLSSHHCLSDMPPE